MGIADNTKRTQVTLPAIFMREAEAGNLSPILSIHDNNSALLKCLFETGDPK